MGGNGPHSGARNSSFGLATLRRDGYAAVRASATTSDPSSFNPNLVTTLRPAIPLSPSPRFLRLTLNSGLQPSPRPSPGAWLGHLLHHQAQSHRATPHRHRRLCRSDFACRLNLSPHSNPSPPRHRPSTQHQLSPQAAACRLVSSPRRRTRRQACSPTSRYRSPLMQPTHPSNLRAAPPSRR